MCKLTTTSVIKTPNQIEHVSTEGGIIHERTMFRGSEYLVWLVITQTEVQFGCQSLKINCLLNDEPDSG